MSVEQSIQDLKVDMKEIKDTLKKIESVLGSFSERFVSNEKDLERMINEYVRMNADSHRTIDELKCSIRDQDDLIWQEIRRCQGDCKSRHEKKEIECKELIIQAKADVKKDIKAWIAFAIVSALGAIVFSVISTLLKKLM